MAERYAYDKGNGTVRDTATRTVKYEGLDAHAGAIVAAAMNNLSEAWAVNDAQHLKLANAYSRIVELEDALTAAQAELAAVTADRDELKKQINMHGIPGQLRIELDVMEGLYSDAQAKLAAVPMAALLYRLANSEQSPECWGDWDNRGEAYEKASNEIDAWLKKVTK